MVYSTLDVFTEVVVGNSGVKLAKTHYLAAALTWLGKLLGYMSYMLTMKLAECSLPKRRHFGHSPHQ